MTSQEQPTPPLPEEPPSGEPLLDSLPDTAHAELRSAFASREAIPDAMHFEVMADFQAATTERTRKSRIRHQWQAAAAVAAMLVILWTVGPWLAKHEKSATLETQATAPLTPALPGAELADRPLGLAKSSVQADKLASATNAPPGRSASGGAAPTVKPQDSVPPPPNAILAFKADPFDLNGDGSVDILDALAIAKALKARAATGAAPEARFDVDGNGLIEQADVDALAMRIVKLRPKQALNFAPRANQIPWCIAAWAGGSR